MSLQSYQETLVSGQIDGTALTAAAAASCLAPHAVYTFAPNYFLIGKTLRVTVQGRISCVVTTPGTARFDVRLGSAVVFDSQALNLNIVAKTNVGFEFSALLTCRTIGASTSGTILGIGRFTSEAIIASPANAAGGSPTFMCPVSAPAVGTGFDTTASQKLDVFFTQTVATGSLTVHNYILEALN